MDNLLETIAREKRREELAKLNAIQIVNSLFNDLMERERDILTRRFGLNGDRQETLERIGQLHKLTRERVRQIENASIKKIKRLENVGDSLCILRDVVSGLLKEHGGLLRRDFLLDILTVISLELSNESEVGSEEYEKNRLVYRNRYDFLLSKLLNEDFELLAENEKFNSSIKLKDEPVEYFESLTDDLIAKVESSQKTFTTEEVIALLKTLESYQRNQEKIEGDGSDITEIFRSQVFPDKAEIINQNKTLYSLMQAVKNLERNKFGYWGKADWQEIKPKTINDKIYLVLKNASKPLHFTEIAAKINEIRFDHKNANPATVHNELILDDRYVLTGRGMYGLKEWQDK
ncbi:MAG: sigma factor-like helix-turn-helix DNA-binding protein [Bacillota bacterium]